MIVNGNIIGIIFFIVSILMSVSDIDYEDIYDINDYEYPYNHININDKLK